MSSWILKSVNLKYILILSLFLVIALSLNARNAYFSVETARNGNEFSFPVFSNLTDNSAANKINQLLQINELELLKGYEKENIFEKVRDSQIAASGWKKNISFEIKNNTNKTLSLKLNESACISSCSDWIKYYNFNSQNGEIIQLQDLFTEVGYKRFYELILGKVAKEFERIIKEAEPGEQDTYNDIIECYKENITLDFYIDNKNIYIDGENCFLINEILPKFSTVSVFKLSVFKQYLNAYGRSVFSLSDDPVSQFRSMSLPQLFSGEIGERKVLLVLDKVSGKEVMAEYIDLEYGKGAFMTGRLDENVLTLSELDNPFADHTPHINAVYDGIQITGNLINETEGINYDVNLRRK